MSALIPGVAEAQISLYPADLDPVAISGQYGQESPALYGVPDPSWKPRVVISIFPEIVGPALVTDEVEPHVGGGISFCFNFVRSRAVTFGLDFQGELAIPVLTDSSGADDLNGTWVGTSIGFPLRLGGTASFFLRPGVCMDIMRYYKDGYTSGGSHWEDEVRDTAFGIIIGLGLDINFSRHVGFGLFFTFRFLPVAHEVQEWWNGFDDGTHSGWLTIAAGLKFLIRF